MSTRMFLLGGTGFIGAETLRVAVAAGWEVRALARTAAKAELLLRHGATPVVGDAEMPSAWIDRVRGCDVLVDLVQPVLPARIGVREIHAASRARRRHMALLLESLRTLPGAERPLLMVASGIDDLVPDGEGRVNGASPVTAAPAGFAHIGVPVRRLVEGSELAATFIYLGTVYGPGKSFATSVFPRLARGRLALPGAARNRFPLVHVLDAARAVVHLAGLERERLVRRSWVVVDDGGGTELGEFLDEAARLMGVRRARRFPRWVMAALLGRVLFETMTRDVLALPVELVATGFRHTHPTHRDGLPPTLVALGYRRPVAALHERPRTTWRTWLAVVAVVLVAVNEVRFPLSVPWLRALAGGLPILDLRLGYDVGSVRALFAALGDGGRAGYLAMLWTVDLVLPALFSAFLVTAVGAGRLRRWRWAALLPGGVDYLENAAVSALLLAHPQVQPGLVAVASALTVTKLSLYLCAVAAAAVGGWLSSRSRRTGLDDAQTGASA
jgi:2-alkyl-3-oxoalkanoate reductase